VAMTFFGALSFNVTRGMWLTNATKKNEFHESYELFQIDCLENS